MKQVLFFLTAAIGITFLMSASIKSDSTPALQTEKVIVMVNTATWCPVCAANGPRVKGEVVSQFMSDPGYRIVVNDMSDDASRAASKKVCKAAGIDKFAKLHTSTGTIYFINAKTKVLISKISVTEKNETIAAAFKSALSSI